MKLKLYYYFRKLYIKYLNKEFYIIFYNFIFKQKICNYLLHNNKNKNKKYY